jgi:hypothetical protein
MIMALPTPSYYWDFNKEIGQTVPAVIGNANMVFAQPPQIVPGKGGNAVRFIRNGQYDGTVASTTIPELPLPWTVSFWITRDADIAHENAAVLFSSLCGGVDLVTYHSPNQVGITQPGVADYPFDYSVPFSSNGNIWVNLIFVGNSGGTALYVDGKLVQIRPEAIRLGLNWIGSKRGEEDFAAMTLDELRVFNQALSAEQAAELAKLVPDPGLPELGGLWYWGGLPGPRISVSGNNLTVDMSAYRRPTASGTILGPNQIRVTFPDDNTFTGTLSSNPARINWSNNTVWTKAP